MKYYDIVTEPCSFDEAFAKRLGFEAVFRAGRSGALFIGSDMASATKAAQHGAVAVAITDFTLDRGVMAKLSDNETVLCIPIAILAKSKGLEQARLLHRAAELVRYAYRKRIDVSFASLASSRLFMESRMQLIELAKMLGATEEQARLGVGEVNRKVIEGCSAHDEA